MSPRARRSESITLPPGNQPGLIRYNDDVAATTEKSKHAESKEIENDYDTISDDIYDTDETHDSDSDSISPVA
jgi:hypothetical protein